MVNAPVDLFRVQTERAICVLSTPREHTHMDSDDSTAECESLARVLGRKNAKRGKKQHISLLFVFLRVSLLASYSGNEQQICASAQRRYGV